MYVIPLWQFRLRFSLKFLYFTELMTRLLTAIILLMVVGIAIWQFSVAECSFKGRAYQVGEIWYETQHHPANGPCLENDEQIKYQCVRQWLYWPIVVGGWSLMPCPI